MSVDFEDEIPVTQDDHEEIQEEPIDDDSLEIPHYDPHFRKYKFNKYLLLTLKACGLVTIIYKCTLKKIY